MPWQNHGGDAAAAATAAPTAASCAPLPDDDNAVTAAASSPEEEEEEEEKAEDQKEVAEPSVLAIDGRMADAPWGASRATNANARTIVGAAAERIERVIVSIPGVSCACLWRVRLSV
mmetsp:Transcript_17541/g.43299  ORF Transcript_17541/g.43299 Transcript_17541/m.43299 type:complete len:117 (-) Transcript_17541:22-372(-)